MEKITKQVVSYNLLDFLQEAEQLVKEGYSFDFNTNAHVPQMIGSLVHAIMVKDEVQEESKESSKPEESSEVVSDETEVTTEVVTEVIAEVVTTVEPEVTTEVVQEPVVVAPRGKLSKVK